MLILIPDPDFCPSRIPNPAVKKAWDFGSGSATLWLTDPAFCILLGRVCPTDFLFLFADSRGDICQGAAAAATAAVAPPNRLSQRGECEAGRPPGGRRSQNQPAQRTAD